MKPQNNLGIWLYCLVFLGIFIFEGWLLYKIISYVL